MQLRHSQTDDYLKLVEVITELLVSFGVNYATGGGKTLLSLAVAAQLIQRGVFDRALVLTPGAAIVKQFLAFSGEWIHPTNDEFEPFCLGEITSASDGVSLELWLTTLLPDDQRARILVTTHQMYTTHLQTVESALLRDRRTLVIVDEAQGAPWVEAEACGGERVSQQHVLGRSITRLQRAGLVVGKFTGTPTRSDGLPVFGKDDYTEVSRSLHQLMIDGMCPQYLHTRIVHVDGLSVDDEDTCLAPFDSDKGSEAVLSVWNEYDRIPACTRVKPRSADDNREVVDKILSLDPRVINASGDDPSEFFSALSVEAERRKDGTAVYSDYQTMFVGMTRPVTGVDSPSRALGIFYGIPRSMNVLMQFMGRTLRRKVGDDGNPLYRGYPDAWLNRVQLVFLIGGLPSEEHSREAHLGVLFQALALAESLNQAAMLGRMFARYYDGLSRTSGIPPDKEKEILKVVTGEDATGKACTLLLEAELDIVGTASAQLDDLDYQALGLDGKLRYVEGWLRAHTRLTAEAEGIPQPGIQAIIDAAVLKYLPSFKALLTARVATQPENEVRAQAVLTQVPDQSLQDQVQALFEEFKTDIHELGNSTYVLDARIIEYHRTKATLIFKRVQALASTDAILERVQAYRDRNDGHYPELDQRDPIDARVTFKTHDQHLRTGHYPGFEGELGELLYTRCERTAWWEDAREVEASYQALRREGSPALAAALRGEGRDKLRRIQAAFGDRVVVRYYPRALHVANAKDGAGNFICSDEFLRQLTLPEANRLGGAQRLAAVLKAHQLTFDTRGMVAVRERLGFL